MCVFVCVLILLYLKSNPLPTPKSRSYPFLILMQLGLKFLGATNSKFKGNYNVATNVISTEIVRNKNVDEVRRKKQTYFFFQVIQNFNPNYIRIRKGWEQGLGVGRGFDFTIQSIFWNNFFTGKSLLKQSKYMALPNKHLTYWSINNAKTHK